MTNKPIDDEPEQQHVGVETARLRQPFQIRGMTLLARLSG